MAILAPKSPQYRSGVRLSGFQGRRADLRPAAATGRALTNLGNVITQRADQLKKERDASVAGELYNEWRDQERAQVSELLARKGKDADNLGADYDNWFNKSFSELDASAENGTQQRMLTDIANRKRGQGLDILARYEAQEKQRYKKEVEISMVTQAEKDVRQAGFDDEAVEESIGTVYEWIDNAHPGRDTGALKQQYKSQLLFANMQERINIDAKGARVKLEEWKEDLGEGYFSLVQTANKKERDQLVEGLRGGLNAKYNDGVDPDFDAMKDEISNSKTIPDEIKDSVLVWVRAQEREFDARQANIRQETLEAETDTILESLITEDYVTAYDNVVNSNSLSFSQKLSLAKWIKSEAAQFGETTDKLKYIETAKAAFKNEIGEDEIIETLARGVGVDDVKDLLRIKKGAATPEQKELNEKIGNAEDAIEKQIMRGGIDTGFDAQSIDDSYKAIVDFYKRIENPPEGVTVEEMLDYESPHYIIDDIVRKNQASLEEKITRQANAFREDVKPAKKDETPEEYLKRIK